MVQRCAVWSRRKYIWNKLTTLKRTTTKRTTVKKLKEIEWFLINRGVQQVPKTRCRRVLRWMLIITSYTDVIKISTCLFCRDRPLYLLTAIYQNQLSVHPHASAGLFTLSLSKKRSSSLASNRRTASVVSRFQTRNRWNRLRAALLCQNAVRASHSRYDVWWTNELLRYSDHKTRSPRTGLLRPLVSQAWEMADTACARIHEKIPTPYVRYILSCFLCYVFRKTKFTRFERGIYTLRN